jgi:hypothetical protein
MFFITFSIVVHETMFVTVSQITFHSDCESWNQLKRILSVSGIVHIKQKAGCLSYKDDPQGFRSLTGFK